MNNLTMYYCGDPILREIAAPVTEITPELLSQMDEMARMIDAQQGVGMAAPQVGISQRFIVAKCDLDDGENTAVHKIINPKIVAKSDENVVMEEGCLSVVGADYYPVFADVSRPAAVTIEWTDETGAPRRRELSGYPARILQHEIDHLDGVLFIDYLSSAKREMVMRKVKKRK